MLLSLNVLDDGDDCADGERNRREKEQKAEEQVDTDGVDEDLAVHSHRVASRYDEVDDAENENSEGRETEPMPVVSDEINHG